jgi:hypothetical protein
MEQVRRFYDKMQQTARPDLGMQIAVNDVMEFFRKRDSSKGPLATQCRAPI